MAVADDDEHALFSELREAAYQERERERRPSLCQYITCETCQEKGPSSCKHQHIQLSELARALKESRTVGVMIASLSNPSNRHYSKEKAQLYASLSSGRLRRYFSCQLRISHLAWQMFPRLSLHLSPKGHVILSTHTSKYAADDNLHQPSLPPFPHPPPG